MSWQTHEASSPPPRTSSPAPAKLRLKTTLPPLTRSRKKRASTKQRLPSASKPVWSTSTYAPSRSTKQSASPKRKKQAPAAAAEPPEAPPSVEPPSYAPPPAIEEPTAATAKRGRSSSPRAQASRRRTARRKAHQPMTGSWPRSRHRRGYRKIGAPNAKRACRRNRVRAEKTPSRRSRAGAHRHPPAEGSSSGDQSRAPSRPAHNASAAKHGHWRGCSWARVSAYRWK